MKAYTKAFLVAAGLFALAAPAQEKCEKNYGALQEKTAGAAYDEAIVYLDALRKDCPKYDVGVYDAGNKLLTYKYETAATDEQKSKIADNLIKLYSEQQNNFPGSGADIKKALFMYNTKKSTDAEVFKILDQAFTTNSKLFTDYTALELYFNLYLKQYEAQAKGVTMETLIVKYGDIAAQTAAAKQEIGDKRQLLQKKQQDGTALDAAENAYLAATVTSEEGLDGVAENMAKQGAAIFSCEKLEGYYSAGYEKNQDNISWIKGMVNSLRVSKCNKSELLYRGVTALYKSNPTFETAYDMGYYSQKRGDAKAALVYYEEAAARQLNPVKKAELYMDIASLYRNSDKAKAKEFALKAAETNAKYGKPYLFIAEMYKNAAGKECGFSDFDKKALVWPAIAMLKKAEAAEPKFKATVAKLEEEYAKSIPTKKEAKAVKKSKGDVITFGCWINETVTLPKLK